MLVLAGIVGYNHKSKIQNFEADPIMLTQGEASYPFILVNLAQERSLKIGPWADSLSAKLDRPASNAIYVNARNNTKVFRQTLGVNVSTLPPFAIAHLVARRYGMPTTGLRMVYLMSVFVWGVFLLICSMFVLYSFLRKFYDSSVVITTLAFIIGASYYVDLWQVFGQLTHIYLLFLHACLLMLCHDYFYEPSSKKGVLLGFILGMLVLIRPAEILLLLLPLFWMLGGRLSHLKTKLFHLIKNYKAYLWALGTFLLLIYLQLSYWWEMSDQAFVFNYQVIVVDFSWNKVINIFLGIDAGMILFSPILILMALGFLTLKGMARRNIFALTYSILALSYIAIALLFWWNNGDNSIEFLFQIYPFLALPFAGMIEYAFPHKVKIFTLTGVLFLLVYINLWRKADELKVKPLWTVNNKNLNYLQASFLRDTISEKELKLLDVDLSLSYDLEIDSTWTFRNKITCLNETDQYIKRYSAYIHDPSQYFRFSVEARSLKLETSTLKYAQMIISFYSKGKNIDNQVLRVQRYLTTSQWKVLWIDAKSPSNADQIAISIWNGDSKEELCFKNIKLVSFSNTLNIRKS